ncbi:MAG: hypothetical protein EAZ94_19085 [Oscillatoriales cyanobacterium]|nr:MAG: hypothetical protein EAZ94_19085 [Oscillatoriales cyanobacterium]TAE21986.1 MAG: hypothetical protein EAZ93_19070 [Oscillatoriales cyanobacterium]
MTIGNPRSSKKWVDVKAIEVNSRQKQKVNSKLSANISQLLTDSHSDDSIYWHSCRLISIFFQLKFLSSRIPRGSALEFSEV